MDKVHSSIPITKEGTTTILAKSTDNAGNSSSQTVAFNIIATCGSISAAIDYFLQSGAIDNAGIAHSLQASLDAAQVKMDQGNVNAAQNLLQAFINHVEAQRGKHITPEAAGILIADAQYVIAQGATTAKIVVKQERPVAYALSQNSPNPFNAATAIRYDLPNFAADPPGLEFSSLEVLWRRTPVRECESAIPAAPGAV
jgi:hypothetical protein